MKAVLRPEDVDRMLPATLATALGTDEAGVVAIDVGSPGKAALLLLGATGRTFLMEVRTSSDSNTITRGIERLRQHRPGASPGALPVLAVPFMGERGRQLCEAAGISWLDLSGNACIEAPGLRIRVSGQPNRFRKAGRPSNLFAPRSSRVARWLLMHPEQGWTQRAIARATGLGEGLVSRVAHRLEDENLVERAADGALRPKESEQLFAAWAAAYRFGHHRLVMGHVAGRTGEIALRQLADKLDRLGVKHAATGLAAAWQLTHFAMFRTVTLYLAELPTPGLLEQLAFREEERGANTWLVVPDDEGVFLGAEVTGGVRCVHPLQVVLDLKEQPERAKEAEEMVRSEKLRWIARA